MTAGQIVGELVMVMVLSGLAGLITLGLQDKKENRLIFGIATMSFFISALTLCQVMIFFDVKDRLW